MGKLIYKIRRYLFGIPLAAVLLLLGSCFIDQDQQNEDDWRWDAGSGMVSVRIPLTQSSRAMSPDLDNPDPEVWIDYFEAIFRERTTGTYYIGRAFKGESYITLNVPSQKNYDILVLAGTSVNRGANGVKVLMASGFVSNRLIVYGPNRVLVGMKVHKTTGNFDPEETNFQFVYSPKIENIGALVSAQTGGNLIHAAHAQVESYPDAFQRTYKAVNGLVNDATSLKFAITPISYEDVNEVFSSDVIWYYDLTYYGFSDPGSGSAWSIRRGITHDLTYPTGGAVGLKPIKSYYVHRDGSDSNDGFSMQTPFKTLGKAVETLRKHVKAGVLADIKTITVLGILDYESEKDAPAKYKNTANDYKAVFYIANTENDNIESITIRGLENPGAYGYGPAVLSGAYPSPATRNRVLTIHGGNIHIILEYIEISGGQSPTDTNVQGGYGGGIKIYNNKANSSITLTIGKGTVISKNKAGFGSALWVESAHATGTVTLNMTNGEIKDNTTVRGGAVNLIGQSSSTGRVTFKMTGGEIVNNTSGTADYPTGGVRVERYSTFTMTGGRISGNTRNTNITSNVRIGTLYYPNIEVDIGASVNYSYRSTPISYTGNWTPSSGNYREIQDNISIP
jgi:hypothetical protein